MRTPALLVLLSACQAPPPTPLPVQPTPRQQLIVGPDVRAVRMGQDGTLRSVQLHDLAFAPSTDEAAFAIQAARAVNAASDQTLAVERRFVDPLGKLHLRLRQTYLGHPVDDRSIDVHFRDSRVSSVMGSAAPLDRFDWPDVKISNPDPIAQARTPRATTATHRLVWALSRDRYRLAYEVMLTSAARDVDLRVLVDAASGQVIREDNRLAQADAKGMAYPINDMRGGRALLPLAHLAMGDTLTAQDGSHPLGGTVAFDLRGPFVNVIDDDQDRLHYQGPAEVRLDFGVLDARASEVSAFIHVNEVHDWFVKRFGLTAMDHVVETHVRSGDCLFNAYASGTDHLTFGVGCGLYDYAQSVDYVYHEYGHLVTEALSALDYSQHSEGGAFSEGQSDYWACTITDDSVWGENLLHIFQRHCDNDSNYARDYSGEAHNGAPLYSGSMWDLRKQFGADVSDALALHLLYYLPRRPSLVDVRDCAIEADHELFANAHEAAIRAAFARHGIDDERVVFITDDAGTLARAPLTTLLTAHAQGFDRASVRYAWTFDDGSKAEGEMVKHTFLDTPGNARVTATDGTGLSLSAEESVGSCNAGGAPPWEPLWALALLALRRRRARATNEP